MQIIPLCVSRIGYLGKAGMQTFTVELNALYREQPICRGKQIASEFESLYQDQGQRVFV